MDSIARPLGNDWLGAELARDDRTFIECLADRTAIGHAQERIDLLPSQRPVEVNGALERVGTVFAVTGEYVSGQVPIARRVQVRPANEG